MSCPGPVCHCYSFPPVLGVGETREGGTLGTSPSPGVTHRKLSISQPVAQGLKAVKFPVGLCGERQPGFRWVSQQALDADSPQACQSLPIA